MKIRSLTWGPQSAPEVAPSRPRVAWFSHLSFILSPGVVNAQQKISKRYPGGKNVRIELRNISGTVVVESWNKDEIRLTAIIESKKAHVVPKQVDECLMIDVMSDKSRTRRRRRRQLPIASTRQFVGRSRNSAGATSVSRTFAAGAFARMFPRKAISSFLTSSRSRWSLKTSSVTSSSTESFCAAVPTISSETKARSRFASLATRRSVCRGVAGEKDRLE